MSGFYKLSNSIIDKVTGFDINSGLFKVLEMDSWSRDKIEDYQKKQFNKLTEFAAKSEFYSGYKGKELSDFPIVDRNNFKTDFSKIATNFRKPYSIQHSSGSTSKPITVIVSKEMLLAKRISHQKMLHWYGLERESPEFKIGGIKEDIKKKVYYYLKNKRYVNSFNIKPGSIDKITNQYNKFKPSILYGYPSAIFNFIQHALSENIDLHVPVIICTHAENLYREYIKCFNSVFPDTKVVNQYWATEANMSVTCPEGNLHLDEDSVICEVINEDKQGVGDLLVTNLFSYDFPIIRYKIGDRVKLSSERCPCGRNTKVLESIQGRSVDYILLPDSRKIPVTAIYLSRYTENIIAYQLAYSRSKKLMEFRYVANKRNALEKKDEIIEYFKNDYGLLTKFKKINQVQKTSGGKFKKVLFLD